MTALHMLAPEARALLLTIGTLDPEALAAMLGDPGLDWRRLAWLAEREKATIALARAVDVLPTGCVPQEHGEALKRLARVTEFRMHRLEQLLGETLHVLHAEDIDVLLLKGAGLATTAYGSFAARPMYDIDLLVRPDEASRAWEALRSAGWIHDEQACPVSYYDSHYHLPPLDDPMRTGLSLELHTAPTDGAVSLSSNMMWKRARQVTIRGLDAWVPAPEHQLLHLAAHFGWTHGLASAAWRTFSDLDRLAARTLDWDVVLAEASTARATTVCYWTLRLAGALTDIRVPQTVLEHSRPPRPEWALRIIERHLAANLFHFSPAPCPSVRMTQAFWVAAIAPRWSGHGDVRPWDRGVAWAAAQPAPTAADATPSMAARGISLARHISGLLRAS